MEGFSPASPPPILWKSRKRSAGGMSLENALTEEESINKPTNEPNESTKVDSTTTPGGSEDQSKEDRSAATLSDRRRALFEPLDPVKSSSNSRLTPAEVLLPPPDFDSTSYPKGWLVGKKRKLVNVDVVESMRRIAVQEMNRKDREIGGLNEQLEEDARCLEHLQVQLLQERSKRADVERENAVLQDQVSMLMNMLDETQAMEEEEEEEEEQAPTDS